MAHNDIDITLVTASLQGVGVNSSIAQQSCTEAGIDHASLTSSGQHVGFSFKQFAKLQSGLWRSLNDEAGGFLNRPMPLGAFAMLCHAIIGAQTLGEALQRLNRFMPVLADDLNISMTQQGDQFLLGVRYDNVKQIDERFFVVSMATLWLRLSCWLVDRPLLVQRVDLAFDEPAFADELPMIFATEINYNQAKTQLVLDRDVLQLRVRQDQQSLQSFLQAAPMSLLTRYRRDTSYAARVRTAIKEAVAAGQSLDAVNLDQVSDSLTIASHTLRRRLRDEQTSFQSIRDRYRRALALDWLENSERSVAQIADELGFSEPAAFTRAFKRWYGAAPTHYQTRQLKIVR